jgi:hypothetical protein
VSFFSADFDREDTISSNIAGNANKRKTTIIIFRIKKLATPKIAQKSDIMVSG